MKPPISSENYTDLNELIEYATDKLPETIPSDHSWLDGSITIGMKQKLQNKFSACNTQPTGKLKPMPGEEKARVAWKVRASEIRRNFLLPWFPPGGEGGLGSWDVV